MRNLLARFVIRDSGEADSKDGLFVGTLTQAGIKRFGRGHVFEIVEVLDEVLIKDLGPSYIKPTIESGRTKVCGGETHAVKNTVCWSTEIGSILNFEGKHLFLTEAEYVSLCEGNHD